MPIIARRALLLVVCPLAVAAAAAIAPTLLLVVAWLVGSTFDPGLVRYALVLSFVLCVPAAAVLVPVGGFAAIWGVTLRLLQRDADPGLLIVSLRVFATGLALLAIPAGVLGGLGLLTHVALGQPRGGLQASIGHATRYASAYHEVAFWRIHEGASEADAIGALGEPLWRIPSGQGSVLVYSSGGAAERRGSGFHFRAVSVCGGIVRGTSAEFVFHGDLPGLNDLRCEPAGVRATLGATSRGEDLRSP